MQKILFDKFIDRYEQVIDSAWSESVTYWLEIEWFIVDQNDFAVPWASKDYLALGKDYVWGESWTFQLEISWPIWVLEIWSLELMKSKIELISKDMQSYYSKRWMKFIYKWIVPNISDDYFDNEDFFNQSDKYLIERNFWKKKLSKDNNSFSIRKKSWQELKLKDIYGSLALISWIHVNLRLRNPSELKNFYNYSTMLSPIFYGLSSNASYCNGELENRDVRLAVGLFNSKNYISGSDNAGLFPYINKATDYFRKLNSWDHIVDYKICEDIERNAYEVSRETSWVFQQLKLLEDNKTLLYEYRVLTVQDTVEDSCNLWYFFILTVFWFTSQAPILAPLEEVSAWMSNAWKYWIYASIFDPLDYLNTTTIKEWISKNYHKILNYWIDNWYLSEAEGKNIKKYIERKMNINL